MLACWSVSALGWQPDPQLGLQTCLHIASRSVIQVRCACQFLCYIHGKFLLQQCYIARPVSSREMSGSHSSKDSNGSSLLGCYITQVGTHPPAFWRTTALSSSGSESKKSFFLVDYLNPKLVLQSSKDMQKPAYDDPGDLTHQFHHTRDLILTFKVSVISAVCVTFIDGDKRASIW